MVAVPSMPVLAASTPISLATASICAATMSAGMACTPVTPSVFCAVIAVMALMPKQPSAEKVFRSAWMPAPPPESEPAMVRVRGGVGIICAGIGGSRCARRPGTLQYRHSEERCNGWRPAKHIARPAAQPPHAIRQARTVFNGAR
jgi:hypothetical protein